MIVILFRSRLVDPADGYAEKAEEMQQLARTMPGFVDFKAYTAADGERLTVVWWQDERTLKQWREHPEHQIAQQTGRTRWYQCYKMDVAHVLRSSDFDHTQFRPSEPVASYRARAWQRHHPNGGGFDDGTSSGRSSRYWSALRQLLEGSIR